MDPYHFHQSPSKGNIKQLLITRKAKRKAKTYLNFHCAGFFNELFKFVTGMTAPLVPTTDWDDVVKFDGEGETGYLEELAHEMPDIRDIIHEADKTMVDEVQVGLFICLNNHGSHPSVVISFNSNYVTVIKGPTQGVFILSRLDKIVEI